MTALDFPKPFGPKWLERMQTNTFTGEVCCICGKKMKNGKGIPHVRINAGTISIISPDAKIDSADDQGYFPIGSDCAKKVPRAYIVPIDVPTR